MLMRQNTIPCVPTSLGMAPSFVAFRFSFSPPLRFHHPLSFSERRFFGVHSKLFRGTSTQTTPDTPIDQSDERKSFAVATGELFVGIASRILRKSETSPFLAREHGGESDERIGNVLKDDVEPELLWEQRIKDVKAEKERKTATSHGFSFSAAGMLFPYHLGAAQLLIEKGYIKETTPLAGSSAGAITCAVIASGASMCEALQATKILANDCREKGTAFRLGAVLRDVLEKFLPDDAHLKCSGRVRVAVTQILWRPRSLLIDHFDSKEDLINAVFTSSFIPGYLSPRPATMFRNRLCVDGGLTLFMPPSSADKTIRICCFPAGKLGLKGIGISPDLNPDFKVSSRQLLKWALEPAEDEILDKFFDFGYKDAVVWSEQHPLNEILKDEDIM